MRAGADEGERDGAEIAARLAGMRKNRGAQAAPSHGAGGHHSGSRLDGHGRGRDLKHGIRPTLFGSRRRHLTGAAKRVPAGMGGICKSYPAGAQSGLESLGMVRQAGRGQRRIKRAC